MPDLALLAEHETFTVEGLTLAINKAESVPGRISELGWFQEAGIDTTTVKIELRGQTFVLVPAKPRGAPGTNLDSEKRRMLTFEVVHLPLEGGLDADSAQNVRAFGTESELQQVETLVNRELTRMRQSLDATIEYQRVGALKGQILDADGETVLEDLYKRFELTPNNATLDFKKDLRVQCVQLIRQAEKEQGNIKARGYRALVGAEFMDELMKNEDFKRAYERWQDGQMLRNDLRKGVSFGSILWEEYDGRVGNRQFIADNEAILVPEQLPSLFITRFAPANYNETVNTLGLPYYAKKESRKYGKGWDFEAQSNPINLCTNPRALLQLSLKK
ncbi:major capsid protein [Spartinivicinus ruber]|uniref:major capsid protein n=1 Tax=Spartinivicinus ruber TaxID=2683272 RepID=UPI0013D2EB48|nr:major capsid protein [Spartinivicinus ruber]